MTRNGRLAAVVALGCIASAATQLWLSSARDRVGVLPAEDAELPPPSQVPVAPPRARNRARDVAFDVDAATPGLPAAEAQCEPRASKGCHDGDVYWFDGCGEATERIEACEGRACHEIGCAPREKPVDRCGSVTAFGRCDGELAQACVGGALVTVDCAREGRRCVAGREGVRCEAAGPEVCTGREPARCEGKRLLQCNDGHLESIDCARRNAQCVVEQGLARCVGPRATLQPRELELCNQSDDDNDGKVDEGEVCDAVILVPVVAAAADLADLQPRMQRDLEIVKRIYQPRDFRWAPQQSAPERLARFPTRELGRVAAAVHAQAAAELGAKFFIPVLFVEKLDLEPPKGGISMLPNNRCGGVRMGDAAAPPYGLVVLADERMPETLAHELGHFLGLCHTHEQVERYAQYDPNAPACEQLGDGVCDTAFDPGPSTCKADATCTVLCDEAAARPLGVDVMSYYLGCRRALSADQLREAERNLALRRGWSRCVEASACPCTPGDPQACPVEMSCRPTGSGGFGCALDGVSVPGAGCRDGSDCAGAICIGAGGAERGRCVRACTADSPGCRCQDVGLPFKVCGDDLSR